MNKIHTLVFLVMSHIDIILDFFKQFSQYEHLMYFSVIKFLHARIENMIVVNGNFPSQLVDEKPPEEENAEAGGDAKETLNYP